MEYEVHWNDADKCWDVVSNRSITTRDGEKAVSRMAVYSSDSEDDAWAWVEDASK